MQARYGYPARGLRIVAVTGTNGKTTTISYINEVLKTAGYRTAVLTTAFIEIAGSYEPSRTTYTLQKQSDTQRFLRRAKKAGADFVILEVTSHALDQDRIMGVPVEIGVMTNLSQEHLDYHKTMENYAKAKSLLFQNFGAKYAVLNADDKWYEFFKNNTKCEIFSYGQNEISDLKISDIRLKGTGSTAKAIFEEENIAINTRLLGEFNIYNAAVAASVGILLKIHPKNIEEGISDLAKVDGRMELIKAGQGFRVLVDFAVTPKAIEEALKSLQKITEGKVRIVFGATGDRDKAKRPLMGGVAAKYADFIYLTDDETYSEDGDQIRQDVFEGIKKAKGDNKTKVIADREKAITRAVKDAKKGDTVYITGLGHENTRNMGGKLIPWQEKEVVQEILKKQT